MVATSINPKDWVHVETPTEGHLGEIIKAIVQEVDNFQRGSDVVKNQTFIDSAFAFPLDLIAALVGLERWGFVVELTHGCILLKTKLINLLKMRSIG